MLARTYGRPVLEAFVAAGFLDAAQASQSVQVDTKPDPRTLGDRELIDELVRRYDLTRRAAGHHDGTDGHAPVRSEGGGTGGDTAPIDVLVSLRRLRDEYAQNRWQVGDFPTGDDYRLYRVVMAVLVNTLGPDMAVPPELPTTPRFRTGG